MEFHKVEKIVGPNPTIDTNNITLKNQTKRGVRLIIH